jgi:hypothetical protein
VTEPSNTKTVEVKLRIFVQKPAQVVIPPSLLGGEGLLAFLGDNRDFEYEGGTSRLDLTTNLQINLSTMDAVGTLDTQIAPGTAAVYNLGDFEHVQPPQPPWAGKLKQDVVPSRVVRPVLNASQASATPLKVTGRDNELQLVLSVSANLTYPPISLPDFPGSDKVESILDFLTATIDAQIFVLFRQQADGTLNYLIQGRHDGFPAFEIYINRQSAYTYDPIAAGADPRAMKLPPQVTINSQEEPVPDA